MIVRYFRVCADLTVDNYSKAAMSLHLTSVVFLSTAKQKGRA